MVLADTQPACSVVGHMPPAAAWRPVEAACRLAFEGHGHPRSTPTPAARPAWGAAPVLAGDGRRPRWDCSVPGAARVLSGLPHRRDGVSPVALAVGVGAGANAGGIRRNPLGPGGPVGGLRDAGVDMGTRSAVPLGRHARVDMDGTTPGTRPPPPAAVVRGHPASIRTRSAPPASHRSRRVPPTGGPPGPRWSRYDRVRPIWKVLVRYSRITPPVIKQPGRHSPSAGGGWARHSP